MGALFGYCGKPQTDVLAQMAQLLAHRASHGWEHCTITHHHTQVGIGHSIAPTSLKTQLAQHNNTCLGYAGVLFNPVMHPTFTSPELTNAPSVALPQQLLQHVIVRGATAAEALEGAFVLAWYDGERFYLLRDATGVKALYWAQVEQRLLFASEIKALFADPQLSKSLRPAALAEYFTFSFIPGAGTMLENVYELQPGHLLTFHNGQVEIRRWFEFEQLEWQPHTANDHPPEEYVAKVRQALTQSTEECLNTSAHTPGIFLSGGIDSSAVLAMAADLRPASRLPTFSIHFGTEYPHEKAFIDLMVRHCGTEHHELEVRPQQFTARLEEICWRLDDPIGDPVAMPNYLLAEYAAQHTPVILNGEGGDPCFGGPKNIPMLLSQLYGTPTDESTEGWLERQYLHAFQRAYSDLDELLSPAIQQAVPYDAHLVALLHPFFHTAQPQHLLNKLMATNIRLKGANLILVKVEKMTAANRLLALPPLFSKRIVETSIRVPPALKLQGAVEKSVLKRAVQDLVPQPIIDRPKSGMRVPVHYWFQGELKRFAKQRLSKRRLRRLELFNVDYVQRIIKYDLEAVRGRRHGLKLWMLITFLLWYEQFFKESCD